MANPNPSPATRFKKGDINNPTGKTSAQKRQEMENAEKAVALRGKLLDAMTKTFENMTPEQLMDHIEPYALKMIKDAEDRGLGAPVQSVVSPDGSMSPAAAMTADDIAKEMERRGLPIPEID